MNIRMRPRLPVVIYQLNEVWSANFNFGSGWRPPSVNELYSYGVHHGTAQFEIGDRDLTPERSYSIDMTLKNRSEVSNAEIGLYVNSMKGFIFAFPSLQPTLTLRGIFPTMIYQQSDVLIRGIDASYDHLFSDDVRVGTSVSSGDRGRCPCEPAVVPNASG
jgi:iron complex outermembrane receptor protein